MARRHYAICARIRASTGAAGHDRDDDTVRVGATGYTLSIWNNGPDDVASALVRDAPQAGLVCAGTVACTSVGDAACPAGAPTVAELMAGGLAIPRIASSTASPPQHYVALQVPCQVQ